MSCSKMAFPRLFTHTQRTAVASAPATAATSSSSWLVAVHEAAGRVCRPRSYMSLRWSVLFRQKNVIFFATIYTRSDGGEGVEEKDG